MNKRLRFPLFGGGVSYFSDSPYVPHSFSTCPVHPRRFPVQCGWEGRKLAREAGGRAGLAPQDRKCCLWCWLCIVLTGQVSHCTENSCRDSPPAPGGLFTFWLALSLKPLSLMQMRAFINDTTWGLPWVSGLLWCLITASAHSSLSLWRLGTLFFGSKCFFQGQFPSSAQHRFTRCVLRECKLIWC